jgi:hypothetical protein
LYVITSGVPKTCAVVLVVEELRPNLLITKSVLLGNFRRGNGSAGMRKTPESLFILLSGLFFSREQK